MNTVNKVLSFGAGRAARLLSRAGLPAEVRRVPNIFGERDALIIGRGSLCRTGSEILTRQRPFINDIGMSTASSTLTETPTNKLRGLRTILNDMKAILGENGFSVSAIYFCKIEGDKYGDIINTSPFRSEFLTTIFRGTPLIPLDIDMINGKIEDPWNMSLFGISSLRYMGKIDPIVKRVSMLLGAKSYVVMLVRDDLGKVIGKVNIGLKEARPLSGEALKALDQKAQEISKAPKTKVHLLSDLGGLVKKIKDTPLWKFLPFLILEGPGDIVSEITGLLDEYHTQRERHQSELLRLLANAIEAREPYTYRHSISVAEISDELVDRLFQVLSEKTRSVYSGEAEILEKDLCELGRVGGRVIDVVLLHDIGKIAIEDAIMKKQGPLDAAEREKMDRHSLEGAKLLENLPDGDPLKPLAIMVLKHHHEDFDGLGQPDSLSGAVIPVMARLVRVADSYHAMTTSRPYREFQPTSHLYALAELVNNICTQFDPNVVKAFLQITRDGLLPKEDYFIEGFKTRERELRAKPRGGADDAEIENSLNLIRVYRDKLSAGKPADELKREFDAKTLEKPLPELFVGIFNEAYDGSGRIIEELRTSAQKYLDFVESFESAGGFEAIADHITAAKKQKTGYTKEAGREVVKLFVQKTHERWLDSRDVFRQAAYIYQVRDRVAAELAEEKYKDNKEAMLHSLNDLFNIFLAKLQS